MLSKNRRTLLLSLLAAAISVKGQNKKRRDTAIDGSLSNYARALNGSRSLTPTETEIATIVGLHAGFMFAIDNSRLTRNGAALLGFLAGYEAASRQQDEREQREPA